MTIETPIEYDAGIKELSDLMFRDTDHPRITELAQALQAYEQKTLLAYFEQLEPSERRELLDIVQAMIRVQLKTRELRDQ